MLGTVSRWCFVVFSSDVWNIPSPIDQFLNGYVVQIHVKIIALCKQQWPPEQHPGKKSRHILHLLCHQGQWTIVTDQALTSTWGLAYKLQVSNISPAEVLRAKTPSLQRLGRILRFPCVTAFSQRTLNLMRHRSKQP